MARWRHFLAHILTPAERKAVKELVLRGGTNAEIARRLRKSPRTVEHQLESAFRKLREFLDWPEDFPISRNTLTSLLTPYLEGVSATRSEELHYKQLLLRSLMFNPVTLFQWPLEPRLGDLRRR
ncbi:helix-turn-helix domain-containing protein [Candidatus Bipolaricaulota bacterium]|nr:helix-turn-helix domain-containing protein [Candidatus Bipolaricaulota bacterium]